MRSLIRFPEAAGIISLERLRSTLKHWRLNLYPPYPTSLEEFKAQLISNEYDMVLKYLDGYEITSTNVIDEKGDEHILFYDKDLIKAHFSKSSHLSMDATFEGRINLKECSQLFTLLALRGDNVIIFPFIFVP